MKRCANGVKKHRKVVARWGLQEKWAPAAPNPRIYYSLQDPPKSQNLQKSLFSGLLQRVEFATKYSLLASLFSFLSSQMRPKRPQDRSKSAQVRPKSFEIVERCRKKSRKQTLEPQVRNPRTKQAARRSTRRKIRRPRVRSSPYDPHEESSASQRKPPEFPNNPKDSRVAPRMNSCQAQPAHGTSLARGRRCFARRAF